jgi:molybdenum ABC transporter molybdate-binding protein
MLLSSICIADSITLAAASDLKFAMDEIINSFEKKYPNRKVNVVYGSSGKLLNQIIYRAPFDLYFSADISYPQLLEKRGNTGSKVFPYAIGRLVLWSHSKALLGTSFDTTHFLQNHRIAIASPKHAPYGIKAKQVLENARLWNILNNQLVYGESVSHAAQFVMSEQVEFGIVALSLALSPSMSESGDYVLIPEHQHDPLLQGFVITKYGANKTLAQLFANYMFEASTIRILDKYGFKRTNLSN